METIFSYKMKSKKGHSSHNNRRILTNIEFDLNFMIIYLRIEYEFNIPMFSKDIEWKPFRTGRTGQDVRTDSGDTICPPPPPF